MRKTLRSLFTYYTIIISSSVIAQTVIPVGNSEVHDNIEDAYNSITPLSGDYIIELQSDYDDSNENYPINFNVVRANASNQITIRPASGVTGSVTEGNPGAVTSLITFNQADYITLDGRPGGTGATDWTIRNTRTGANTSSVFDFFNDANNNTLRNLIIEGEPDENVSGIIDVLTTSQSTGNDNNSLIQCKIQDLPGGLATAVGIYVDGTSGKANSGWLIDSCEFVNIYKGNSSFGVASVQLVFAADDWTIRNSHFYQTGTYTSNNAACTFIYAEVGGSYDIENNYFGGQAPFCEGDSFYVSGGAGAWDCIYFPIGSGGQNNITGNVWQNMRIDVNTNSAFPPLSLIFNSTNMDFNVSDNIFGDTLGTASITSTNNAGSSSKGIYCLYNDGNGSWTVDNNHFGAIRQGGTRVNASTFIIDDAGASSDFTITDNTIGNPDANSIQTNSNSVLRPIYVGGSGTHLIDGNTIQNIDFNATGSKNLYPIRVDDGDATITENTIRNVHSQSTGSHSFIAYYSGLDGTVSDNTMEDITVSNASAEAFLIDISSPGNVECDNNTLGGTNAASISLNCNNSCSGIDHTLGGDIDLNGNIIRNVAMTNTGISAQFAAIDISQGAFDADSNQIYNLTSVGTISNDHVLAGFDISSTDSPNTLTQNVIHDLDRTSSSNSTCGVMGIYINGPQVSVEKNLVYDLENSSSNNSAFLRGIYWEGNSIDALNNLVRLENGSNTNEIIIDGLVGDLGLGTSRLHHNTVMIGGSQSAGAQTSSALFIDNVATIDLNNNIFQSTRTGGSGDHYSISWDGTGTLNNDYNFLQAVTASKLCDNNGANENITTWKSNTGASNSISGTETLDTLGKAFNSFIGADGGLDLFTGTVVVEDITTQARDVNPWMGAHESGNSVPFYWVGDSGNWSDFSNHWSNSSGGPADKAGAPTSADVVIFDANSFGSSGETVTIDVNSAALSIDFTGSDSPVIEGNSGIELEVYGDFILNGGETWDFLGRLEFKNLGGAMLNTGGVSINSYLQINGGGTIFLEDDLFVDSTLHVSFGILSQENMSSSSSYDVTVTKDVLMFGNWIGGTGLLSMNGNGPQMINIGSITLNELEIDNSSSSPGTGVSISGDLRIAGVLNLTDGIILSSPGNEIKMLAGSSCGGGSSDSYVQGPLRKIGNTDFVFPTGANGIYAEIGISNLTGPIGSEFTAEYFDTPFGNIGSINVPLNNVSALEYWDLDQSGPASNADVTVYWEDWDFSGIDNSGDLSIAHWNGSAWDKLGQSTISFSSDGDITFGPVTSFSPFTFGSDSPVVNLLSLNDTLRVGDSEIYTTIQAAYNAIPTPIDQPYWIELQSDYDDSNESPPIVFKAKGTAIDSIVIVPANGVANTEVALDPGANNPLFRLDSADHVYFDGRPGGSGDADFLLKNTHGTPTTTGPVIMFENDADSNVVQFITIESENRFNSMVRLAGTNAEDGNDFNEFRNSTFQDIQSGGSGNMPFEAIGSNGQAGKPNTGTIIDQCHFVDIYDATNAFTSSVRFGSNSDSAQISNNHFYQSADYTTDCDFTFSFINIQSGEDYRITGNYMGGQEDSTGGSAFVIPGGTSHMRCISLDATTGASGTNIIAGNKISNLDVTLATSVPVQAGLNLIVTGSPATMQIGTGDSPNILGDTVGTGSITLTNNSGAGAYGISGIFNNGFGTINIHNNKMGSWTLNGTANNAVTAPIYTQGGTCTFTQNTIGNSTANNILISSNSPFYGIYSLNGTGITANSNTIQNIDFDALSQPLRAFYSQVGPITARYNSVENLTSASNNELSGFYHTGTAATINQNNINTFINANGGGATAMYGVYVSSASTCVVDSNIIGAATANNMNNNSNFRGAGIWKDGTGDFFGNYNTVQNWRNTNPGSNAELYGIAVLDGQATITNDTIRDYTYSGTRLGLCIAGIYNQDAAANQVISSNYIAGLSGGSGASFSGEFWGVYVINGNGSITKNYMTGISTSSSSTSALTGGVKVISGTWTALNNVINLSNGGNNNSVVIDGIRVEGDGDFRHNTVLLSGTAGGGGAVCSGINSNSAGTINIQNNVFQNLRTGTGSMYAERIQNIAAVTTDFNYLEVENDPNQLGNWNGTDHDFANYQTNSGATSSLNAKQVFDTLGKSYTNFVGAELGQNLGIPDDFESTARDATPWIGAYESGYPIPSGKFFVNDSLTVGDVFTSEGGDDEQGCGSSDRPCRSVSYTLSEYVVNLGDTVFIDAGRHIDANILVNSDTPVFQGAGKTTTIFDGASAGIARAFEVLLDSVVFNDLKIVNYDNGANDGGGVNVGGAGSITTHFFDVRIDSCTADNGGGIHTEFNGDVRFENCNFEKDSATGEGGALSIGLFSNMYVNACTFGVLGRGNYADEGGAIQCDGNDLTILSSTFTSNVANGSGFGGGAINAGGSGQITDCAFDTNSTLTGDGGAIYLINNDDLIIDNCSFTRNASADDGGAISCIGSTNLYLQNGTTVGALGMPNKGEFGAGVYFSGDTLVVDGSSISYNESDATALGGGAIYSQGANLVFLNNANLNHNSVSGADGGAIRIGSGPSTLLANNSSISNNYAGDDGGALYVDLDINLIFDSCRVDSNSSADDGGAFYFTGDTLFFLNGYLRADSAGGDGGAIYANSSADIVLFGNDTIDGCVANVDGGALYFTSSVFGTENSQFTNNLAGDDGGVLYASGSAKANFDSGTKLGISGNGNSAVNGGAIYWFASDTLIIDSSEIAFNDATATSAAGGAVYLFGGNMQITKSEFYNNTASGAGGDGACLYLFSSAADSYIGQSEFYANNANDRYSAIYSIEPVTMENCLIYENISGGNDAVYFNTPGCTLINNTITDNTGLGDGLEMAVSATGTVTNTIVYNNNAQDVNIGSATLVLDYSIYGTGAPGAAAGSNNQVGNPGFSSPGTDDYSLAGTGSIAYNTGTAAGAPTEDIIDTLRPSGGAYDIGAYELYVPQSISTNPIAGSPFNQGDPVTVNFVVTNGPMNGPNTFYVELSDSVGDFTNADTIGTLVGTTSGAIVGTIPLDASDGTQYRIRVVADDPGIFGTDNGTDFIITSPTSYFVNDIPIGGDIYTSGSGANVAGCGGQGNPCLTVNYLLANSTIGDQDTIFIDAGTYSDTNIVLSNELIIIGAGQSATIFDGTTAPYSRAFLINSDSVRIANLSIRDYRTTGMPENNGAGIRAADFTGRCWIDSVTFDSLHSSAGPAIMGESNAADTISMFINNCTMTLCDNLFAGGAIRMNNNGLGEVNMYIDSCTIGTQASPNIATTNGGAIYANADSLIITNSFIEYNQSLTNGGGVYLNSGSARIFNTVIGHNTASDGGGIYVVNLASGLALDSILLDSNTASSEGGGIYYNGTDTLEIYQSSIDGNVASVGNRCGAGIFLDNNRELEFVDGSIINNSCPTNGADGGALFAGSNSNVVMEQFTIHSNFTEDIGTIFFEGNLEFTNGLIYENNADNGATIFADNSTTSTIINTTITDNIANNITRGGGLSADGGSVVNVTNSILWQNQDSEWNEISTGTFHFTNCIVGESLVGISGADVNNFNNVPLFTDSTSDNYTLLSSKSPAFDAGIAAGAPSIDRVGTARPQDAGIDIGAFEGAPIAPANYFVNDADPTGDIFTSAIGVDGPACGTPAAPCLTLEYIENNLFFGTDDTVFVDVGTYDDTNVVISAVNVSVIGAGPQFTIFDGKTAAGDTGRFIMATGVDFAIRNMTIQNYNSSNYVAGLKDGGALRIDGAGGVVNIDNIVFDSVYGGTAVTGGGAIRIRDGINVAMQVIIDSCVFTNDSSQGDGGALYVDDLETATSMEVFISNSTVGTVAEGNSVADDGGAIFFDGDSLHIRNTSIRGNRCVQEGGALYLETGSTVLKNCILANDTAGLSGGAVHVATAAELYGKDSTYIGLPGNGNYATTDGGGIRAFTAGEVFLDTCFVSYNETFNDDGGGVYLGSSGQSIFRSTTISFNEADDDGGGIFTAGNDVTLINCIIDTNRAVDGGGLVGTGNWTVSHTKIMRNFALGIGGGFDAAGTLDMDSVEIFNNEADQAGGMRFAGSVSNIDSVKIFNNRATLANGGGGLFIGTGTSNTIQHIEVFNNAAEVVASDGGGIVLNGGVSTFDQILVYGNSCTDDGGAIYSAGSTVDATFYNSIIYENSSQDKAVISGATGTMNFFNCTIADNTTPGGFAAGVNTIAAAATINLTNVIAFGNDNFDIQEASGLGNLNVSYSSFGTAGSYINNGNNISGDPLFVNAPADDYNVQPTSPTINAGTNVGAPLLDIRDTVRPQSAVTDMGAFEQEGVDTLVLDTVLSLGLCQGDVIPVVFFGSASFGGANAFNLELSDEFGSFGAPLVIGTLARDTVEDADTIFGTIPAAQTLGTLYRLRITSSLPSLTSNDNGYDMTVSGYPGNTVTPSATNLCTGTSLNITADDATANSYLWNNGFSGQVLNLTLPGTYYCSIVGGPGCRVYSDTTTITQDSLPFNTIRGELLSQIGDNIGGFGAGLGNSDWFGWATEYVGDLDNDGVMDLAVGAIQDDDGGSATGAVYIIYMNANGTVKSKFKINNTALPGELEAGDDFGSGIAFLGDMDNDGVGDIAVGARREDEGGSSEGAFWILNLNSDGSVKNHTKITEGVGGFAGILNGADQFGRAMDAIGDLDGNGVTDLAVGAYQDDDGGSGTGALWILFLNPDGTVLNSQKISELSGGFTGSVGNGDNFGREITSLGDMDGDGIVDIVVASPQDDDGGTNNGSVYILFLNANGTVKSNQKISSTVGGLNPDFATGSTFGSGIENLGDIDGDGVVDLMVGAAQDDVGNNSDGSAFVLLMNNDGTVKEQFKLDRQSGNLDFDYGTTGFFGNSINALDDYDSDGRRTLVIAANQDDDGGSQTGAIYVMELNPVIELNVPTSDTTMCAGDSIQLIAGNLLGYDFEWFREGVSLGAATLNDSSIYALDSGYYYAVVSDPITGCSNNSDSASIRLTTPDTAIAATGLALCMGDSVVLYRVNTATAVDSLKWFRVGVGEVTSDTLGSVDTLNVTGVGNYFFTTYFNGCDLNSDTLTVLAANPLLVVSTSDADSCGTLRFAMNYAVTNPGPDTIRFDATLAGATISPATQLPVLSSDSTYIIGDFVGSDCVPDITIDGGDASIDGFEITGWGNIIQALHLINFAGTGTNAAVRINASVFNYVMCSYIGTNSTATATGAAFSNDYGVVISGNGVLNVIGDTTGSTVNIISGNNNDGILITSAKNNVVVSSIIGLDITGMNDLGNGGDGIAYEANADTNIVGGCIVGGNDGNGINVVSGSGNAFFATNVGLNIAGTGSLGNDLSGFFLDADATNSQIGDGSLTGRNFVSGNGADGIHIRGDSNLVVGNFIGVPQDGLTDEGNGGNGITITQGAFQNQVGNGSFVGRNVISGNNGHGIEINSTGGISRFNTIIANIIGADSSGMVAVGNGQSGVRVSSRYNIVGTPTNGNFIAGNTRHGIWFSSDSSYAVSNVIGSGIDSVTMLPNGGQGLFIDGGVLDTIWMNRIAYNDSSGIKIDGAGTLDHLVRQNAIFSNSETGILHTNGSQEAILPPVIVSLRVIAGDTILSGTGYPGSVIQLYADSTSQGFAYLDTTVVDGTGEWKKNINGGNLLSLPVIGLDSLTALQDSSTNTSEFSAPFLIQLCDTSNSVGAWVWTGADDDNWFNCANWDVGTLPGANAAVTIPVTGTNPRIENGTAYCKTISINAPGGAQVNVISSNGGQLDVGP